MVCVGCEDRSKNCLDCKHFRSETFATDQINLEILRNAIKILPDPSNNEKRIIEIDYQISTDPYAAIKKELSNHVHTKASSLVLYES